MDTDLILAIDLAQFKSVACAYPRWGGKRVKSHSNEGTP
jgi:hypothetical protein